MNRILEEEIRLLIVRDLLHRGMWLHSHDGRGFAHCGCGYLAEVDWHDAAFGQLHSCTFTDKVKEVIPVEDKIEIPADIEEVEPKLVPNSTAGFLDRKGR